jgi:aldose 1-epimerase
VLPELGARLHRLRAFGVDVLRTPDDPATHVREPFFWGAYVMAPWCNRVQAGPVEALGRVVDLPSNFPDGTAIHGQVSGRPWKSAGNGSFRIRGGGDGWPWIYEVEERLGFPAATTLRVELALTNRSDVPMPAGLGIHPWFRRPLEAAVNATTVHASNLTSDREPLPVRDALDLRRRGPLAAGLDGAWTEAGDPAAELSWPETGIGMELHVAAPEVFVVLANPTDIDATAIEPQTHGPQGLRRLLLGEPGALAVLEPDSTLALTMELRFSRN